MAMTEDPHTWTGAAVRNPQGEVLGHVDGVYFHDVTGRATWAAVTDGAGVAMVPLDYAEVDGHGLCLPYRVDQLAGAPRLVPGPHLDPHIEHELYRYYGITPTDPDPPPTDPPAGERPDREERHPGEIVRSREQMRTRIERRPYARVRLVTYIVTENVTFTVPVSRQEVRLEQIPLDETDHPDTDQPVGELTEDVHEVVLHRQQVSFTTTTVPTERVRLVRRIVEGRQSVSAQLRSEKIDIERTHRPIDPDPPTRGAP